MNPDVEIRHAIVMRDPDGLNVNYFAYPGIRTIRRPYVDGIDVHAVNYKWDGRETNVMGQPVFRCSEMPPWRFQLLGSRPPWLTQPLAESCGYAGNVARVLKSSAEKMGRRRREQRTGDEPV